MTAGTLVTISFVFALFTTVYSNVINVVQTGSGPVQGVSKETPLGRKVNEFLGIPFAAPPVGPLRFKAPVPVKPWIDVLNASVMGPSCIQVIGSENGNESETWWIPSKNDEVSEDCLRLNIWVPDPLPETKTAVMIWIHGGGFVAGTSASWKYDGKILASEGGVIVVTLNYRLSAFGFLYLDPEEAPGNMGLMDQALAMKWVKDNIINFGGDPDRITIFGESSGGAAVSHHITIPTSEGLFNRVIAQSGVSNAVWATVDTSSAIQLTEIVANASGCPFDIENRRKTLDCLRNLDVTSFAESTLNVTSSSTNDFTPVIDGRYIPVDPEKVLMDKAVDNSIDVMLGTTTEDGSYVPLILGTLENKENAKIDHEGFAKYIETLLKTENKFVSGLVQNFYTNWANLEEKNSIRDNLVNFTTDYLFLCKTNLQGDLLAENGNRVYNYQLSHKLSNSPLPKWAGTVHADDINFVFGWPLLKNLSFTQEEADLSRRVIGYWTSFAKNGNPNGNNMDYNDVVWPLYTKKTKAHLYIEEPPRIGTSKDFRTWPCAVLNHIPVLLSAKENQVKGQSS